MGVESGRNDLLFSLAVLGGLVDRQGKVWLCSDSDLYLVEVTLPELRSLDGEPRGGRAEKAKKRQSQSISMALPLVVCEPPREEGLRKLQSSINSEIPKSIYHNNNAVFGS